MPVREYVDTRTGVYVLPYFVQMKQRLEVGRQVQPHFSSISVAFAGLTSVTAPQVVAGVHIAWNTFSDADSR